MTQADGIPTPRAALSAAPDVPRLIIDRLRHNLATGGFCLCQPEDLMDGTLPPDTPLLALFRRVDANLLQQVGAVGSRPGGRVLGIAVTDPVAEEGDEPIEVAWRGAGQRADDLLLWDGVTEPRLVLGRLRERLGPVAGPAPSGATTGCRIDVVLRTGRVLRVRPDIAPDLLRRFVAALEE